MPASGGLLEQPNLVVRRFEIILMIGDEDEEIQRLRLEAEKNGARST